MLTTSPNPILCPKVRTIAPDGFTAPHAIRTRPSEKRRLARLFRQESARDFLGDLRPGMRVVGVSRGQFSAVDLLRALSGITGPADLSLSTWTTSTDNVTELAQMMDEGRFTSTRWLLDFSFQRRAPSLIASIRAKYGVGSITLTRTHAKILLLANRKWHVVAIGSANLNRNDRLEVFDVADDHELHDFFDAIFTSIFKSHDQRKQITMRPGELVGQFAGLAI